MQKIDWARLQSFASVAEHGSLSAAARATCTSQPTLSRHVATLEEDVGLRLFDRTSEGLVLTAAGAEIYASAQTMMDASTQIELIASGRSQEIEGTVRITASDAVASHILPSMLVSLRRAEPRIAFELVATNDTQNLLKREADIAVRMYRPTQNDVITRKVGELKLGMFASTAYLDERGRPTRIEEAATHDFLGLDRNETLIAGFRERGMHVDRNFFPYRTDAFFTHLEFIRAGCGIGLIHDELGRATPGLEPVMPDLPLPVLEFWLTAHVELRTSLRIRRVFDFLAERISERYGAGASPGRLE